MYARVIGWHTGLLSSRTQAKHVYPVLFKRPDLTKLRPETKKYRNPVSYAQELHDEMVRDNLTRKQLAERYGVSSDRITKWLCLLKLPKERRKEILPVMTLLIRLCFPKQVQVFIKCRESGMGDR